MIIVSLLMFFYLTVVKHYHNCMRFIVRHNKSYDLHSLLKPNFLEEWRLFHILKKYKKSTGDFK